jgi:hypothetical protein
LRIIITTKLASYNYRLLMLLQRKSASKSELREL